MTRIDCSGVLFGSDLDERHLFTWGAQIPGFVRWDGDTMVVRRNLSEAALRELIALLARYAIPMQQLRAFANSKNRSWFADPRAYWHKPVFARRAKPRLERTGALRARLRRTPVGTGRSTAR
jgi:hypothetical protein